MVIIGIYGEHCSTAATGTIQRLFNKIPGQWAPQLPIFIELTDLPLPSMPFMAPYAREFEGRQIHVATPFHAKTPTLYINYKNFCSATWREQIRFQYQLLTAFGLILWNHRPELSSIVREAAEKQFGPMPRVIARNHFLRAFPRHILRNPAKFQSAYPKDCALMQFVASRITPQPALLQRAA